MDKKPVKHRNIDVNETILSNFREMYVQMGDVISL